jgi:hypothetical protein
MMIAGRRAKKPTTHDEARDWEVGEALLENAGAYLAQRGAQVRRFLGSLITSPGIAKLMSDVEETRRQRDQERRGSTRVAWDRLRHMESVKFAQEYAVEICRQFGAIPRAGGQRCHVE